MRAIRYVVRRANGQELTREPHLTEARQIGGKLPLASHIVRRTFEADEKGREVRLYREQYICGC